jgi:hypothetical protein
VRASGPLRVTDWMEVVYAPGQRSSPDRRTVVLAPLALSEFLADDDGGDGDGSAVSALNCGYSVLAFAQFFDGKIPIGTSSKTLPLYAVNRRGRAFLGDKVSDLAEAIGGIAEDLRSHARTAAEVAADQGTKAKANAVASALRDTFMMAAEPVVENAVAGMAALLPGRGLEAEAAWATQSGKVAADCLRELATRALALFDGTFPIDGIDEANARAASARASLRKALGRRLPKDPAGPKQKRGGKEKPAVTGA